MTPPTSGTNSFAGTLGADSINAVNAVRGSDFVDTVTAAGARGFFQFIGLKGNDTFTGTTEAINNFDFNMARYDVVSTRRVPSTTASTWCSTPHRP